MNAGRGSVHIGRMKNLRTELVAMLEEFEHFAYDGAPLSTATEKVREILDKTAPKVLTTEAELNSEEAFTALCIMPYGGPLRTASSRHGGVNYWQEPGSEDEYSTAELLAHFAKIGAEPAFTLIKGVATFPAPHTCSP